MDRIIEKNIYVPVIKYKDFEMPLKHGEDPDRSFLCFSKKNDAEDHLKSLTIGNEDLQGCEINVIHYKRCD